MQRTSDPQQTLARAIVYVHDHDPGPDRFEACVIEGLSRTDKALPFRFLYDEAGSRLFDRICQQPEYYPTRTEMQILRQHAGDIADLAGPGARLIELGSGAGRKTATLLEALEAPAAYIPVDISRGMLLSAARQVAIRHPGLPVHAVWADFSQTFDLPRTGKGRAIGFFPGSSIGNFTRAGARGFLASWKDRLGPGAGMIVGVDLIKPVPVLEAAYNDEAGITAAFSLNILRRMNRELGADFKPENFRHDARYNSRSEAIEIHLISETVQEVRVSGQRFRFARGETLHLESSHKYDAESFADLARQAGFTPAAVWTDPGRLFSVHFLSVPEKAR